MVKSEIISIFSELNSDVEISINTPGEMPKSTFVDRIFVIRLINQSILL